MLFVKDLKENYQNYNLPKDFVDCLLAECPSCGALTAINESLTHLRCSNPRCKDKIIMRIKAICDELGILGFGESTIEKYVDYYKIINPLKIFQLEPGDPLGEDVSMVVSEKILEQLVKKKDFQLWEYVKIANLPNIQTSSRDIFQGYSTLEEAYADIKEGGVSFIQKKIGVSCDNELSIRAAKIYESLIEFEEDLLECVGDVNIINLEESGIVEISVVCSDQVGGGFAKKKDFYEYVNTKFQGKVHVNFLGAVKKSIDYLVWAGADGSPARYTSKVKTVEGYNNKGCNIPILTAAQFIEELENIYG